MSFVLFNPAVLERLTPEERAEVSRVEDALSSGEVRSVAALLKGLSPRVRAAAEEAIYSFDQARQRGGRAMPFEPKRDIEQALSPEARAVLANLDDEHLAVLMAQRMGTDQPDTSEPSRREVIEALAAAFEQGENNG